MKLKMHTYSPLTIVTAISAVIWVASYITGELIGRWGANEICNKFLGCTKGFLGYDGLEHFLFGFTAVFIIIWAGKKFPDYSLLSTVSWKNAVIVLSVVAFLAGVWEFFEFAYDIFRLKILNQPLVNFTRDINLLYQPTNLDTMGDLISSFAGSVLALLLTKIPRFDVV